MSGELWAEDVVLLYGGLSVVCSKSSGHVRPLFHAFWPVTLPLFLPTSLDGLAETVVLRDVAEPS